MLEFSWPAFFFTVVNFLILVALLYKFLHKPILDALDNRKRRIEEAGSQAEEKAKEAEATREKYEQQLAGIQEERDKLLSEARHKGDAARDDILAKAREEAERETANLKRDWERQRRDALESLEEEIVKVSLDLAQGVLQKVAGADVESKLRELRQAELAKLGDSGPADAGAPVRVVSAKPLSDEEREQVTGAISALGEQFQVEFDSDEALVAGSRIEFSNMAIDASLAGVLGEVRERFAKAAPDQDAGEDEKGTEAGPAEESEGS